MAIDTPLEATERDQRVDGIARIECAKQSDGISSELRV